MSKEPKVNKRATMESEFDVKDLIIIDNGSDTIKVGISGEDYPRVSWIGLILDYYRFCLRCSKYLRRG